MRQEITRRARNRSFKDELRARSKALTEAVANKDTKKISEAHSQLVSQLDKAVKKNLLHKNNAARKKSAAAKLIKEAGVKPTATKKPAAKKPAAKKAPAKKAPAKKPAAKKPAAKKTSK